jgi:hypothetical protein
MAKTVEKRLAPGEGKVQFGLCNHLGICCCPNCLGYTFFNMNPPPGLANEKGYWDEEAFCNFCGALLKITFLEEYNKDCPYRTRFTVEEIVQ